jgi:flagellar biosynthesis/type III secretory pathway M-ring protein FliF/YscJ
MALIGLLLTVWIAKRILLSKSPRSETEPLETIAATQVVATPNDVSLQTAQVSVSADFETLRTQLNQQVARDPAVAAEVLRKWLNYSGDATNGAETNSEGE